MVPVVMADACCINDEMLQYCTCCIDWEGARDDTIGDNRAGLGTTWSASAGRTSAGRASAGRVPAAEG